MINALTTQALQHLQAPYAWVELFSMACGLLGSLVLALKRKRAGWGWVLFAASNAGWIVFAYAHEHWFLLVQQVGFSFTSLLGIWSYLVKANQGLDHAHQA
jgi:CHASE2 domain-containing sensor protein